MPSSKALTNPVTGSGRIELLDIYRGFALFGIYMVNIRFMSSSVIYGGEFEWMKNGTLNQSIWWILQHFFNEKFFPIFSFLFGVGFGMQIVKMEEKKSFSAGFFFRRYFILMVFGIIHVVFLWPGDVLILYATAGMLLLVLRKVPLKYLMVLGLIILLFPFYLQLRNLINQGLISGGFKSLMYLYDYSYNDIVDLKVNGTFYEKLRFRIHEYSVYYRNVEYFPLLFSMIITGYCAGKVKFYNRIPEILTKLKYVALIVFIYIISIHIIYFTIDRPGNFIAQVLLKKSMMLSNIFQAFLYLYLISWLYLKRYVIKILQPLTSAGRMSLTNYMMYSVVAVLVFNGVLKYYGKFDLVALELFAFVVFVLLVVGSKYWLNNFRYGPLEWIWRELSYRKYLDFRINENIHISNNKRL